MDRLLSLCTWMLLLHTCVTHGNIPGLDEEDPRDGIRQPKPYYILEELPVGTLIGNVPIDAKLANHYNASILSHLTFAITRQTKVDNQVVDLFEINRETGIVKTKVKIDRDELCANQATCLVDLDVSVSPAQYYLLVRIVVDIFDINDNAPTFPQPEIVRGISESSSVLSTVSIPRATDADSNGFGIQRYELESSSSIFVLMEDDGESDDLRITITGQLDRESVDSYQFQVVAFDGGRPVKSGSVLVNIEVLDANDNAPQFHNSIYKIFVLETVEPGTAIGKVSAHDADIGPNAKITYSFTESTARLNGRSFRVDNITGTIYLTGNLDFETEVRYILEIMASDGGDNGRPAFAHVTIQVEDSNDNSPVITVNTLTTTGVAQVSEAAALDTLVAYISADDEDEGDNGHVQCSSTSTLFALQGGEPNGRYSVITATSLQRDAQLQVPLRVICHDLGINRKTSTATIHVEIIDSNDHGPVFSASVYTASLAENNYVDQHVLTVTAVDEDSGSNGEVRYSLHRDAMDLFRISPTTGAISAQAVFDRETTPIVRFHALAEDQGSPRHTATTLITLHIRDRDDNGPIFNETQYSFGVFENLAPGSQVGVVQAVDNDKEPYNVVHYEISAMRSEDAPVTSGFDIGTLDGRIFTTESLDRETHSVFYLTVTARSSSGSLSSSASVTVYLADTNDNAPEFIWPHGDNNTVSIPSHLPAHYVITQVVTHDADLGDNAQPSYAITASKPPESTQYFEIDPVSGTISTRQALAGIARQVFTLEITARDHGGKNELMNIHEVVILVNTSLPNPDESPPVSITNNNLVIITSLTSASIILIFLFFIAVFLIKKTTKSSNKRPPSSDIHTLSWLPCWRKPESSSANSIPLATSMSPILTKSSSSGVRYISNPTSVRAGLRDSVSDSDPGERPCTYGGGEGSNRHSVDLEVDIDILHLKQSVKTPCHKNLYFPSDSTSQPPPDYTSVQMSSA